ncbi:GGDEF domain-containing protein [Plesiomonas shigelloides]|uniref:GGDEF domain-containing protein n=1 Tax=Plesiomonas shigelloides TaxID=703 RepID=UPI0014024CDF|nr:GGDEF domain-containing protein [Plesiomonas shigelloides]
MMSRLHNEINLSFLKMYSTLRRVKVAFSNSAAISNPNLPIITAEDGVTLVLNLRHHAVPQLYESLNKIKNLLDLESDNHTHLLSLVQKNGQYGYFTPYRPHYQAILNSLAKDPESLGILKKYHLAEEFDESLLFCDIRTSEVYKEEYSHQQMLSIFMPIFDKKKVSALAVVDLNSDFIAYKIRKFNKENNTYFQLSDSKGMALNIPCITTQEYIYNPRFTPDSWRNLLFSLVIAGLATLLFNSYTKLKSVAFRDKLTGLHNRSYFQRKQQNLRHGYIVVLMDIDDFKAINDHYGHDTGDKILRGMAEIIQRCARKDDLLIRWGGEEFLLVLYTDNVVVAQERAEFIRKTIAETPINGLRISVSIGVSACTEQSFELTFKQADIALYQSKALGKNQVTLFRENTESSLPPDVSD